jgi:peptidoglycan/LPS O-acetylase OafA/YrhL
MNAPNQIRALHALRALAALFVVAFHATVLWRDRFDPHVQPWLQGNAGVDLFFVISGFIMMTSTRRLRAQPRPARRFIELRLIRIVPLYWGVTAAKLLSIAAFPAQALHTRPTPGNILASFLFLPSRDGSGTVRPVLDVGWTLSFEMLFYAVFALAVVARIDPVALVTPVMAALATLSPLRPPDAPPIATLADPLVLEFLFGVLLARIIDQRRASRSVALSLALAGLLCLALVPTDGHWMRAVIWGSAATACLGGCVLLEAWLGRWIPAALVLIGEASYALYLTHGFVLPLVGAALATTTLAGRTLGLILIAASLAASVALAIPVHLFIEKPVTERLRRLAARPASTAPAPIYDRRDQPAHLVNLALGRDQHATVRRAVGNGAKTRGDPQMERLVPGLVAIEQSGTGGYPPPARLGTHVEDEREVGDDRQQPGQGLDQGGALA